MQLLITSVQTRQKRCYIRILGANTILCTSEYDLRALLTQGASKLSLLVDLVISPPGLSNRLYVLPCQMKTVLIVLPPFRSRHSAELWPQPPHTLQGLFLLNSQLVCIFWTRPVKLRLRLVFQYHIWHANLSYKYDLARKVHCTSFIALS